MSHTLINRSLPFDIYTYILLIKSTQAWKDRLSYLHCKLERPLTPLYYVTTEYTDRPLPLERMQMLYKTEYVFHNKIIIIKQNMRGEILLFDVTLATFDCNELVRPPLEGVYTTLGVDRILHEKRLRDLQLLLNNFEFTNE